MSVCFLVFLLFFHFTLLPVWHSGSRGLHIRFNTGFTPNAFPDSILPFYPDLRPALRANSSVAVLGEMPRVNHII